MLRGLFLLATGMRYYLVALISNIAYVAFHAPMEDTQIILHRDLPLQAQIRRKATPEGMACLLHYRDEGWRR